MDDASFPPHVLREYSLLADGERGAILGPHGQIVWLCVPRWDSDAVFTALLGGRGAYQVCPDARRAVLLRQVRAVDTDTRLQVHLEPAGGYGSEALTGLHRDDGVSDWPGGRSPAALDRRGARPSGRGRRGAGHAAGAARRRASRPRAGVAGRPLRGRPA